MKQLRRRAVAIGAILMLVACEEPTEPMSARLTPRSRASSVLAPTPVVEGLSPPTIDLQSHFPEFAGKLVINNDGVIAGGSGAVNGTIVWRIGEQSNKAIPGFGVWAINNKGQLAGTVPHVPFGYEAGAWSLTSGVIPLGTLNGPFSPEGFCPSTAYGINDAGVVVGVSTVCSVVINDQGNPVTTQLADRAFVASVAGGGMSQPGGFGIEPFECPNPFLNPPTFTKYPRTQALAVNNNGVIVGDAIVGDCDFSALHAWSSSGGDLGPETSSAVDVNDQGQTALVASGGAAVWEHGQLRLLGTLGGTYSLVRAINNLGYVAGLAQDASGRSHAVVWTPKGTIFDLLSDAEATDINDKGQVVGVYYGGGPLIPVLWELDEDHLVVEVSLDRDEVRPVLAPHFNAVTQTGSELLRPDLVAVTVRARWEPSGRALNGAILEVSSEPEAGSGGHGVNHGDRPLGTIIPFGQPAVRGRIEMPLPADGVQHLTYKTSGVSGVEAIRARVTAGDKEATGSARVTVRWPGLTPMPRAGAHYFFSDQDPAVNAQRHGNTNHFSQGATRVAILALFDDYFERYDDAESFIITDASLEWGGLLDVDSSAGGVWKEPHQEHRTGEHFDVSDGTVPEDRRKFFWQHICPDNGLRCDYEVAKHHWHVHLLAGP